MLQFLNVFYTILHLFIIGFNLLGWIWPQTRKAHLFCITITACSWFVLGIWFGIGYCPVTDWQWKVKTKLGETNLPASFITYFGEKITGLKLNPFYVDLLTLAAFVFAVIMSVYATFRPGRIKR